jgi:2-(1,2-epoxy-1,2-dihydrophenyl)acetyl-CoA isomerase
MTSISSVAAEGLLVGSPAHGVRMLTLNRPERLNAIDLPMARALRRALQEINEDPSVRAIVLTGMGGNFCTGADLKRDKSLEQDEDILVVLHDVFRLLYLGPKPSVAALQGYVYGAGLSLALACDFLAGDETTRYCAPFTGIGFVPDVGMVFTLPRRVDLATARSMMLAGAVLDAAQAHACSLIDTLCRPAGLESAAVGHAVKLGERAPLAVAAARRLINFPQSEVDAALAAELAAQQAMRATEDLKEGAAAFKEKRKAVFAGR